MTSRMHVEYTDDAITLRWQQGEMAPAVERTFAVDPLDRPETKNRLKQNLYALLSDATGQYLPWGTLTGIRPTKIPMKLLEEGKSRDEIYTYMKQTYFASDEKICLATDIAERELSCFPRSIMTTGTACISDTVLSDDLSVLLVYLLSDCIVGEACGFLPGCAGAGD